MRFGLVISESEKAKKLSGKVKKFLESQGHVVLVEKLKGADVVLTLGGDGTLIHSLCKYIELNVPFFGINVGTLGFLTAEEEDGWETAVVKIIAGDFIVSERLTLEAEIANSKRHTAISSKQSAVSYRAVNEVVVKGMYRVVDLEILVNGQKFMEVSGDGLIVSTQTGSTAYSLSAGGPIVDPELDCFVMTPVNAHGLPVPSVVLSPDDEVEIKVKDGHDISLIIDGQEHTKIESGQNVKVTKGRYRVRLGYFDKHHFLKALNGKFGLVGRFVK
ncbi:MAG: NAD(+)/NADH kinase [Candidatus Curtissbacteria bacterium]|nr:NAD(+)/NADH kinase [Candidatus Curtissbacteria bacterium]MDZ4210029.1 NAD(+)/NADH kinase [Candidatus Curtissbacteria bacterium]